MEDGSGCAGVEGGGVKRDIHWAVTSCGQEELAGIIE